MRRTNFLGATFPLKALPETPCKRSALPCRNGGSAVAFSYEADIDRFLDALADHLTRHIDLDRMLSVAN